MQNAIDTQFGTGKAVVIDNGDGTFTVSFIDSKKDYNVTSSGVQKGINWKTAMKEAKAPENQTRTPKSVIGIGTDGQPVNMDLWEYTLMEDGTYGLNDEESLTDSGTKTSGYSNANLVDGKIQGKIPQYIKSSSDSNFIEVTNINYLFFNTDIAEAPIIPSTVISMRATFNSCENLTTMPAIPGNVTYMFGTFASCTNLINVTNIPNSVTNMFGTFNGCTSLVNVPSIPNSVTTLGLAFQNCTSLVNAPSIPNNVTNMYQTFNGCTSLINAPSIPNSVTDMYKTFCNCTSLKNAPVIPNNVTILCATFRGCTSLQGIIEINARVSGEQIAEHGNNIDYVNCLLDATTNGDITLKVIGTCPVNDKIVEQANNSKISL